MKLHISVVAALFGSALFATQADAQVLPAYVLLIHSPSQPVDTGGDSDPDAQFSAALAAQSDGSWNGVSFVRENDGQSSVEFPGYSPVFSDADFFVVEGPNGGLIVTFEGPARVSTPRGDTIVPATLTVLYDPDADGMLLYRLELDMEPETSIEFSAAGELMLIETERDDR